MLAIEPGERVLLDDRDVTDAIREPAISEAASRAAADPSVRTALFEKQRSLLATGDWVAEGRDIATVVAPDADVQVFLTADPSVRAQRRAAEIDADPGTVLAEQVIRDERDSTRKISPLKPAPQAVVLDTTDLAFDEVVDRVVELTQLASGRS